MYTNKLIEYLSRDELKIDEDELKVIWGVETKAIKFLILLTVCSRLKIKEVKKATKEAMIQRIIAF